LLQRRRSERGPRTLTRQGVPGTLRHGDSRPLFPAMGASTNG
jgi:hypothetical protein